MLEDETCQSTSIKVSDRNHFVSLLSYACRAAEQKFETQTTPESSNADKQIAKKTTSIAKEITVKITTKKENACEA